MSLFQISCLITAIISLSIGALIFFRNRKIKVNQAWFLTTFFISTWSMGLFGVISSNKEIYALIWQYVLDISSIFIPITFFIFTIYLLEMEKRYKKEILGALIIGGILLVLNFTALFKNGVSPRFGFNFWVNPGPLYFIFPLVFVFFITYSSYLLFKKYKESTDPIFKMRILYMLGAQVFGFTGGMTNFFPQLFNVYPFGNYFVVLYVFFISYGTFKYKLFDIKVIATELLTFAIWLFLAIRVFLANSWRERLIDGGLLALVMFFGIFLIKSVTLEVKHREELEQLTQKLEGLSKYKSELISIVAHQLKNPLAVVKGYSSLIGDGTIKDPLKIQEVYQKIKLSTNKLIDLLNNLLDLGHIEDGKMHYELGDTDLNKMLSEIVNDFQFAGQQKNIAVSLDEPLPEIATVKADPYKLSQVFRNLVDNAIKYTEVGWVKVQITLNNELGITNNGTGGQQYILVRIYDSGRGGQ